MITHTVLAAIAATSILSLAAAEAAPAPQRDANTSLPWAGGARLSVEVPARVSFTQGPAVSVRVSGPERMTRRVYLQGDHIRYRRPIDHWFSGFGHGDEVTINITAPNVGYLGIGSAASGTVSGVRREAFTLDVSGASRVTVDVQVDALTLDVSGASNVTARGQVRRLSLDASGASGSNLDGLRVAEGVNADISGASRVRCGGVALRTLTADLSGSSGMTITGRADRVALDLSGASHATMRDFAIGEATIEASGASGATISQARSARVDASGASMVRFLTTPASLTGPMKGVEIGERTASR